MHFCTVCKITFLVGGACKPNVVLEKFLKNGCNFLYEGLFDVCDVVVPFVSQMEQQPFMKDCVHSTSFREQYMML